MVRAAAEFDFNELVRLGLPIETYAAGEPIFAAGDEARAMYVVLSGNIEIIAYGEVLDRVGPGGIFGEMALIDGDPRSASAKAAEQSELVAVDRVMFVKLVRGAPEFALAVMAQMARRIREMNDSL
ncbi:MAG: Crp/Fnr family transcriptional regulator [Hyphomicrobiaceae bacterium]|nr:Crp/Fnr family transcriptional regulator [Hyphomicrobiaceae bacterium]